MEQTKKDKFITVWKEDKQAKQKFSEKFTTFAPIGLILSEIV